MLRLFFSNLKNVNGSGGPWGPWGQSGGLNNGENSNNKKTKEDNNEKSSKNPFGNNQNNNKKPNDEDIFTKIFKFFKDKIHFLSQILSLYYQYGPNGNGFVKSDQDIFQQHSIFFNNTNIKDPISIEANFKSVNKDSRDNFDIKFEDKIVDKIINFPKKDFDLSEKHEDIFLEHCFWSQLPGNFSFLRRQKIINTGRIAGFASLHSFPSGSISGNHWGSAICALKTVLNTPFFFNFFAPNTFLAFLI